jgi:hypothetical protein
VPWGLSWLHRQARMRLLGVWTTGWLNGCWIGQPKPYIVWGNFGRWPLRQILAAFAEHPLISASGSVDQPGITQSTHGLTNEVVPAGIVVAPRVPPVRG